MRPHCPDCKQAMSQTGTSEYGQPRYQCHTWECPNRRWYAADGTCVSPKAPANHAA